MASVGVRKPTVGLFRGQKTPARDMSKLIGALSQRSLCKLCYPSPKITLVTPPECGYNKVLGEGKWREGGSVLGCLMSAITLLAAGVVASLLSFYCPL